MTENVEVHVATVRGIQAVPLILEVVCRTTGMGFSAIAKVTEDRWTACAVQDNIQFGIQPGGELKVETTICNEIRQTLDAVIIDHVAEDEKYSSHHTPALYGFQSYISMPIMLADGTFFGTLCAIDPRPARLKNPETIGMFKLFAELIGFHLNASDRLAASEADLLDERKTSELREQFLAVLGHDLRNPLASIDASARMLNKEPITAKGATFVSLIQSSVGRMSELIDNVLDLARGRLGGGLSLERTAQVQLGSVLEQVVDELRAAWPDRLIATEFAVTKPVSCDRARIAQLLSNLVGNALTHGATDEVIRVEASTQGRIFEMSVINKGQPIPPAMIERLFQPFFRVAARPGQQGLGLGLYISNEIAKSHSGSLKAVSTSCETRFTFRMPLI
ncbi:GAF domain-containing sensor histidine kinase [Microvirga pudoricolor]|uniref:GAF domain-containing sensor histidine kinase n=1 Tax=Microvirga pudoricolor TaxID=2778729 RepID=UPI00194EBBDA|nr:GAF domain-containing sensor histidine kinase [Microvirga pudoricolor]MBM6593749.1 GAF domain-containing sensor histidine kinase [Microvirga pudoricolor]